MVWAYSFEHLLSVLHSSQPSQVLMNGVLQGKWLGSDFKTLTASLTCLHPLPRPAVKSTLRHKHYMTHLKPKILNLTLFTSRNWTDSSDSWCLAALPGVCEVRVLRVGFPSAPQASSVCRAIPGEGVSSRGNTTMVTVKHTDVSFPGPLSQESHWRVTEAVSTVAPQASAQFHTHADPSMGIQLEFNSVNLITMQS